MEIKEKLRLNQLYDIYGELLTEKQKTYFDYYYLKDYSLSEIADLLEVSRNAVHMQLKHVVSHLEHYEDTLGILKQKEKLQKLIKRISAKALSLDEIITELEKV